MEEKTGQLIRALAGNRTVRVLGVDVTLAALEMCSAHKLSGAAAQLAFSESALGHTRPLCVCETQIETRRGMRVCSTIQVGKQK